jgi:hypothetical protein
MNRGEMITLIEFSCGHHIPCAPRTLQEAQKIVVCPACGCFDGPTRPYLGNEHPDSARVMLQGLT